MLNLCLPVKNIIYLLVSLMDSSFQKEYGIVVDSSELSKFHVRELVLKNCLIKIVKGT